MFPLKNWSFTDLGEQESGRGKDYLGRCSNKCKKNSAKEERNKKWGG